MEQLKRNLQSILEEKLKLTPDKIKSGETIFGVEGTYEGSGVSSDSPNNIMLFKTMNELNSIINDDNINIGQKSIVYGSNNIEITDGCCFDSVISISKDFTIDIDVPDNGIEMRIYSDYETGLAGVCFNIYKTYAELYISDSYYGLEYLGRWLSEDGKNYIGQDSYEYSDWMYGNKTYNFTYKDIELSNLCRYIEDDKNEDNEYAYNLFKQICKIAVTKFGGIYEYTDGNTVYYLAKYAYNISLYKDGNYYSHNNENSDIINIDDLCNKIYELFKEKEMECPSADVFINILDYNETKVNSCEIYLAYGDYARYRSNILIFKSLNEYCIGKDDSSGIDGYTIYTCDFLNRTISTRTASTTNITTTSYSGSSKTVKGLNENWYNKKMLNLYLRPDGDNGMMSSTNVSRIYYYNTCGYRLNNNEYIIDVENDCKIFTSAKTQFTMTSSESEKMIGNYSVLGKDGECTSTNKWTEKLDSNHWSRLLPNVDFRNRIQQDIGYSSTSVPGVGVIESSFVPCKLRYVKNSDMINNFLHNNDEHIRYGYCSEDKQTIYQINDDINIDVGYTSNKIPIKHIKELDNNIKVGFTDSSQWLKWNDETKELIDFKWNRYFFNNPGLADADIMQKHDDQYYVAYGTGANGAPNYCWGVFDINTGEYSDSFGLDPEDTWGWGMGGQSDPTFWFTEGQKPSKSTLQGYGYFKPGNSGSIKIIIYRIVNGVFKAAYTSSTIYSGSVYGSDPDKTVIIGTKSTSSATTEYKIVLPTTFAKTVYNPTNKIMPDGSYQYCYTKTNISKPVDTDFYCIWNNKEVQYSTLTVPNSSVIIKIDNVEYERIDNTTSMSSYSGKLLRKSDGEEVEIATPILTSGELISKNNYQYTDIGTYYVSKNGFEFTNKIYTACEFGHINNPNELTIYDMFVMAQANVPSQYVYSSFIYKVGADILELLLQIDNN